MMQDIWFRGEGLWGLVLERLKACACVSPA